MHIVIPLGHGSVWQDNELRFCLRSIQQHARGWSRILIVGHLPEWVKKSDRLVHIPCDDIPGTRHKEQNIYRKTMKAVRYIDSGNFLFMNDDHFLLQDVDVTQFPTHYKELLVDTMAKTDRANKYSVTLQNTHAYLSAKGVKYIRNFDTHAPMLFDARQYEQVFKPFATAKWPPYGFALKSMYGNMLQVAATQYDDLKLGYVLNEQMLVQALKGRLYFSIGNQAIGEHLNWFLQTKYPTPSIFEHDTSIDTGSRVSGAGMAANVR